LIGFPLSTAVLNTKTTTGVFPFDGTINTGDLTGAAFQTTCMLDHHLSFLVERIKVCGAGIDTEPLLAILADVLVEKNMGLLIILKGIESKLLSDLHLTHLSLSCHSRANGNPGINIIRKRTGFLLPQE
jgi:hypothetical protein